MLGVQGSQHSGYPRRKSLLHHPAGGALSVQRAQDRRTATIIIDG